MTVYNGVQSIKNTGTHQHCAVLKLFENIGDEKLLFVLLILF